jgi:regulatory protein
MKQSRARRPPKPLDEAALNELALRYVGRFATTRVKLKSYLARKVRERGWVGEREPDFARIADRFAELGYVNDEAYAIAKSQALTSRGYGKRRVMDALRVAGIDEEAGAAAHEHAESEALSAALKFARRRRIGPFAEKAERDPKQRQKALAAMVRAGHDYTLASAILAVEPENLSNLDQVFDRFRSTAA